MTRPSVRISRSYAAQATDGVWLSRKNLFWVLAALTVGFFARVNELGAQSLWNDEGTSVALARTSLNALVNAAAHDIHPPLYYILLSGWIHGAGISEFAIRFLSVFAGVLVIAVTFRIAREFFDQDVATVAAVISALNAFQTYYAQETRMYIWVTLFGACSVWMMTRWLKPPRAKRRVSAARQIRRQTLALGGYVVFTLAALYTNYYAFTLLLFQNLAFLVWLIGAWRAAEPRLRNTVFMWLGAQILVVLAYLPWLNFARQSLTSWPGISEPLALPEMTWRIGSAFVTALDNPTGLTALLVGAALVFFVGGLLPSRDLFRHSWWGIVLCALWALVPLLAMYFLSLTRPAYNPKFLLLATPGFLILVARGVSVLYPGLFLRERASYGVNAGPLGMRLAQLWLGIGKFFLGALFAGGLILALQNMYRDPRLQRDDYRGMVNYINAVATERDAVIVDAPGQMDVVRYYYRGAAALKPLPIGRPLDANATKQALTDILNNYSRAYGIFWANAQADPEGVVERALNLGGFKARDEWHGNVRLVEYALPNDFQAAESFNPELRFGDELLLKEITFDARAFQAGELVPLEFEWRTLKRPAADWQIFLHLLDARGQIVSQRDASFDNASGLNRLDAQVDGASRHALVILPGTPPGTYTLQMGLYHPATGARLPVSSGGDAFTLGAVQVTKTPISADALFLTRRVNAAFDTLDFVGYTLERTEFKRGEFIPLALYWQARTPSATDLKLEIQLVDSGNKIVAAARAFETYPPARWDVKEIVRDVLQLPIPPDAPPGEYKIVVSDGLSSFQVTRAQVR